jgi:hypothetical protein
VKATNIAKACIGIIAAMVAAVIIIIGCSHAFSYDVYVRCQSHLTLNLQNLQDT